MKEHLSRPLEKMTENEREYFEAVCQQEADRIISRFKDTPNVLRGIALKLRQAGETALGIGDKTAKFEVAGSGSSWRSE